MEDGRGGGTKLINNSRALFKGVLLTIMGYSRSQTLVSWEVDLGSKQAEVSNTLANVGPAKDDLHDGQEGGCALHAHVEETRFSLVLTCQGCPAQWSGGRVRAALNTPVEARYAFYLR